MPIPFDCPHCGFHTEVPENQGGESGPCRGCGKTVTVPLVASEADDLTQIDRTRLNVCLGPLWFVAMISAAAVIILGELLVEGKLYFLSWTALLLEVYLWESPTLSTNR